MKEIKLIIFDLDGTLVNAYPAIVKSFNYTMAILGYPRQDSLTIRRAVGHGDEGLLKPFIKLKDLKKAVYLYRRHHKQALLNGSYLFDGVKEILVYLKDKGYKLAIASNRPSHSLKIILRHLKLEQYFDYILCADRVKNKKPHPEILKKIMQRFSVKPSETLYIGDMTIDAQTAKRARLKAIIVTTGSSTEGEIREEKPFMIIQRLKEIKRIL